MNSHLDTAILIPTLNEKDNLSTLVPGIFELMPEVSILICDDKSTDGTQELITRLQEKFSKLFILARTQNLGYGQACIEGMKWLLIKDYKKIVTLDADYSHDYRVVSELLNKLGETDVVVGSRYVSNGKIENWNLIRRLLSRFANWYVRFILHFSIKDVTSGFNAYRVASIAKIIESGIKSNGYAFLVEFKYCLMKTGASFSEYPITFKERRIGKSKMSNKVIWESIWLPWRIKFNQS